LFLVNWPHVIDCVIHQRRGLFGGGPYMFGRHTTQILAANTERFLTKSPLIVTVAEVFCSPFVFRDWFCDGIFAFDEVRIAVRKW
jgi:hypothetical protein